MIYYAIKNRKNGLFISGTDFRRSPPRQILQDRLHPPKLFHGAELLTEIQRRGINLKYYAVVTVNLKEVTV